MTTVHVASAATSPQSSFVTVIAWLFIAFSSFGTLISILQNVMFTMMPRHQFDRALQDTTFTRGMTSGSVWAFSHFQLIAAVVLVLTLSLLAASVGLLRRREWARRLFIALLALAVVYGVAMLFEQHSMFASLNGSFPAPAGSATLKDSMYRASAARMERFVHLFEVVMVAMNLAVSALFGWIIYKLMSPAIRAEFLPAE